MIHIHLTPKNRFFVISVVFSVFFGFFSVFFFEIKYMFHQKSYMVLLASHKSFFFSSFLHVAWQSTNKEFNLKFHLFSLFIFVSKLLKKKTQKKTTTKKN